MKNQRLLLEMMCRILKVSRSSYYKWFKEPVGRRKQKYMEIDKKIKYAYFAAKGCNGSPRLAKDLWSKYSKRYKVTTDSTHNNCMVE